MKPGFRVSVLEGDRRQTCIYPKYIRTRIQTNTSETSVFEQLQEELEPLQSSRLIPFSLYIGNQLQQLSGAFEQHENLRFSLRSANFLQALKDGMKEEF